MSTTCHYMLQGAIEEMNRGNCLRICAAAVLFSLPAFCDDGGNGRDDVFSSGIVGSMPNQSVAGIGSGGAPWVVREGEASLRRNGKLKAEVKGLLIASGLLGNGSPVPPNLVGTTGTVTMVAATLVCGGMVVGSTGVVPLSPAGDAEMEGKVHVKSCLSPVVLVRIAPSVSAGTSQLGAFIALSGSQMSDDGQDHDINDDRGNDGINETGDDHGGRNHGGDDGGGHR